MRIGWAIFVAVGSCLLRAETAPSERAQLESDVRVLAGEIGPRAIGHGDSLARAERFITAQLAASGWTVHRQVYAVPGGEAANLEVERKGRTNPEEIVVVGAHYDTVVATPGADDNASGVAALLALARKFAAASPDRTLRFVAFANEEPFYFQTKLMGSRVYARRCKERNEKIVAMLSLESIGYYTEEKDTQFYPSFWVALFRSSRGNYLAFVGNRISKQLVAEVADTFAATQALKSESAALPDWVQGAGWSDHWSFWQEGFPAVMATDTATFRNPHYHRATDTPDTLNFDYFAKAVSGLHVVVAKLAGVK
jgi:Zn-dependent M28 family amino/carboxypeptidase